MRARSLLPLALAAVVAVPLVSSAAPQESLPEAVGSPGMKIVAQIPGAGGTDLEFFSRALKRYKTSPSKFVTSAKPVMRHFSVVGNQRQNTRIVDITNPEKPFVAAEIACTLSQGDVQVNEKRSLIVISNGTSAKAPKCLYPDETGAMIPMPPGAAIVEFSNVYAPKVVAAAPTPSGAHNLTLAPGGRYLYISTSEIVEAQSFTPIFDLADIRRPKAVGSMSDFGNSPHDIRFNAKGTRAYTAGISTYRIYDTTNPVKPVLLSSFFPPGASIGHDSLVTDDGAFFFAGDEGGGGGTYPCPGGAVHVFDIRVEAAPVYLGQSYAGTGPVTNRPLEGTSAGAAGSCTAHVMEMNPDRRSFTLGWYSAGSRVFDFRGLYSGDGKGSAQTSPVIAYGSRGAGLVETHWIQPQGGSTWSAKQYAKVPGYIFSDDLTLGFYVTKLPKA